MGALRPGACGGHTHRNRMSAWHERVLTQSTEQERHDKHLLQKKNEHGIGGAVKFMHRGAAAGGVQPTSSTPQQSRTY
eukprot:4078313-Prymnesium_polylepis.1